MKIIRCVYRWTHHVELSFLDQVHSDLFQLKKEKKSIEKSNSMVVIVSKTVLRIFEIRHVSNGRSSVWTILSNGEKIERQETRKGHLTQGLAKWPKCRTTLIICFFVKSVPIIMDIRQAFDAKTLRKREDS